LAYGTHIGRTCQQKSISAHFLFGSGDYCRSLQSHLRTSDEPIKPTGLEFFNLGGLIIFYFRRHIKHISAYFLFGSRGYCRSLQSHLRTCLFLFVLRDYCRLLQSHLRTIAFHCSEMASLSNWTSGQSKHLKKESKLLTRAFQITYFILILIYRWIRFKKNHLRAIFGF
jgi:hypothetical protein